MLWLISLSKGNPPKSVEILKWLAKHLTISKYSSLTDIFAQTSLVCC